MALEGNLSDFSIPEILQLISSQRKNGVLTLKQGDDEVAFDLDQGYITGGFYRKQGRQEHISEYLFKTGLVSETNFMQAEEQQKALKAPLEEILIERGFLSQDDFEEVIRFKIQEIMDEIFTWVEGHYVFDVQARLYTQSKYPVRLAVEGFLLEGMRRLDEWLRIKKEIPSLEAIVKAGVKPRPPELTPEQENILGLLGQKHLPVSGLVSSSGLGKFLTCQALTELLEMGLAEKPAEASLQPQPVRTFDPAFQVSTISLLIKQFGLLIKNITRYPFNHPHIIANLDGFSHLLSNLPMDNSSLSFSSAIDQTLVNGWPIHDQSQILPQFSLYLHQRQIQSLTFMPQIRDEELRRLAYIMALPPELLNLFGGIDFIGKSLRWHHLKLKEQAQKAERMLSGEKMFVIPSSFLEVIEGMGAFSAKPSSIPQTFVSLKAVLLLPQPKLSPDETMAIEEAEQASEKVFSVYSRGGREKYIEKVVTAALKLPPAPRLALLKRKLLDVRWLFPIDNILALSHSEFERL
ncbi:DUF4388 domain-containing protein [candidate division TA06 bacterium]|uniref:DUF4388 domain-containing protein n=1 Tax=candidate division TA06 bacterium TaxID=2250710 RepID=A0A933MJH5_UNCT6|nr:DUF4388 domain-containing protein [candidate division TA06 bacterium]